MKKSVEIIGQPIISITEGIEFGNVKELLINHTNGTVAALVIDDGKWYLGAKLLPFDSIAGIGEYAVTVNNSGDILNITDRPEFEKLFAAGVKIIGTKVLTIGGRIQGKINELKIDNTGKISVCEMEKADGEIVELSAESVVTFGKEVLIISESNENISSQVKSTEEVSVKPEPAATPDVEMAAPQVETLAATVAVETKEKEQPTDDSAKKFDDKHRKFLLGKKAARRIETDNGTLIVDQGGEITEEVLQKAKLASKFVELSMNIQ